MALEVHGKLSMKNADLLWTINPVKKKQISPVFYTRSKNNDSSLRKWQLLFHISENNSHYYSLFIKNVSEAPAKGFFEFILSDEYFQLYNSGTLSDDSYDVNSQKGWKTFIERSSLFNHKCTLSLTLVSQDLRIILENEARIFFGDETSFSRIKEFDEFEKLLGGTHFSDMTITVGEKNFHVHRCILSLRSPVFNAMFEHNFTEKNTSSVKIDDVNSEVMHELLRFIYTGKVKEIEKIVCELLVVAEKYSVEGLKLLCEDTMCRCVNDKNAIKYLSIAVMNNALKVKNKIISWISVCLKKFILNPEFKSFGILNPEILYQIMEENQKL